MYISKVVFYSACTGKVLSVSEIVEDEVGGGAEVDLGITSDTVAPVPLGASRALTVLVLILARFCA